MAFNTLCLLQRGTLDYMAPELYQEYEAGEDTEGKGPKITNAVDIYSYGCVLWELLTGVRFCAAQTINKAPR